MLAADSYVTGAARSHVNARTAGEHTGTSDEEFWAAQGPALEQALMSGDYPTLARMSEDSFSSSSERAFEFGLHRLLDGIAAFVAQRAAPA